MGKTRHFEIHESLSLGLLKAFKAHATGLPAGFVDIDDEGETSLFDDTDARIGRGSGFFAFDDRENRSRRLDMRTDLDRDPGPIEMEEATPEVEAIEVQFREPIFVSNREGKVRRLTL